MSDKTIPMSDKTIDAMQEMLRQSAAREERLIAALERLSGPGPVPDPEAQLARQTASLAAQRRGVRKIETFHTAYEMSLTEPISQESVRVRGELEFQRRSDGTMRCLAATDDLAEESGDLFAIISKEFQIRNAESVKYAAEGDASQAEWLRAFWAREWRVACFTRGRKPLLNALIGQPIERVLRIAKLAELPAGVTAGQAPVAPVAADVEPERVAPAPTMPARVRSIAVD